MTEAWPLLQVQNLWKLYPYGSRSIEALKDISFDVVKGEILSIMGPSGCGKTTLLNCVSGLDTINKGSITMNGIDQSTIPVKKRETLRAKQLGFIFQAYNLIPVLNAVENVELPLLSAGMNPKIARQKAVDALARVGMRERVFHKPSELSGGQQQLTAIARAIVNQPLIVWADEPTGALDRNTANMVMDLIDHLNRTEQITFIIITHNPDVNKYAHRSLFMDSGQIIHNRVNHARGQTS